MHTDDLTAALRDAADEQPFVPDTARAWTRSRTLRQRRRMVIVGTALSLVAVTATGWLTLPGLLGPTAPVQHFAAVAGDPDLSYTVVRNTDPTNDAPCVLDIVLTAPATPRIKLPCDAEAYARPGLAPLSRQDTVVIRGTSWLLTSGTAPARTVAVTARDELGNALTAELTSPPFTKDVVFVLFSKGHGVEDLGYELADGTRSQTNSVHTP